MNLTIPQLFQSFALNRCRVGKLITPERLLNHFGVDTLIRSVAADPKRLADIVIRVTGTHRKIVEKYDIEKSIEQVNLSLDVEAATPDDLFDETSTPAGISTDEIALFFPGDSLFDLWFNAGWLGGDKDDKEFMAHIWDFIIEHNMFGENTHLDLVMELGLSHFMSDKTPATLRTALFECALKRGEPMLRPTTEDSSSMTAGEGKPFTAKNALTIMPPSMMVEYILITDMARPVESLAKRNGWIKSTSSETSVETKQVYVVPPPLPSGTPKKDRKKGKDQPSSSATVGDEPETTVVPATESDVEDAEDAGDEPD